MWRTKEHDMRHASILIGLVLLAGGCEHTFDAPDGFVMVEPSGGYLARAVSADGVVIGLRAEPNPAEGTLAFWSEAIGNELTDRRGYKLIDTTDVESTGGLAGTLMDFATKQELVEMRYMTAVFVTNAEVLVAEAGGKADAFAAKLDDVKAALLTAR